MFLLVSLSDECDVTVMKREERRDNEKIYTKYEIELLDISMRETKESFTHLMSTC